ncbi:hypothetical protein BB561_002663 [Smittium simulii]|uniref:PXA domain-containing protein n=1 Tax=Smittium simulii TaxID=133385 RepID=A0A2T9YPM7_9FUNG|nr:hypothetical protein BB561_002663 [Smittium simulii]
MARYKSSYKQLSNDHSNTLPPSTKSGRIFSIYGDFNEYPATLKTKRPKFTLLPEYKACQNKFFESPRLKTLNNNSNDYFSGFEKDCKTKFSENEELNDAFFNLIKLALKDFVHSWYSHISSDATFEKLLFNQFAHILGTLFERTTSINIEKLISEKVITVISTHLYQYRKTELLAKNIIQKHTSTLFKTNSTIFPNNDIIFDKNKILAEVDQLTLVTNNLFVRGNLHPAVSLLIDSNDDSSVYDDNKFLNQDTPTTNSNQNPKYFDLDDQDVKNITDYLRNRFEKIIPYLQDFKYKDSGLRNVFVREIFSCSVFGSVIMSISDPDTINSILENQLETIIKEKNLIEELNNVINYSTSSEKSNNKTQDTIDASRKATSTIENILLVIKNTDNILTLQNTHDKILEEIRKKRILIAGQDRENIVHGELVGDVMSQSRKQGFAVFYT